MVPVTANKDSVEDPDDKGTEHNYYVPPKGEDFEDVDKRSDKQTEHNYVQDH